MKNKTIPTILCLLAGMLSFTAQGWTAESGGAPVALKFESAVNPFIDVRNPVLSWQLNDSREGAVQSAWRVIAASTPDKLAAGEGDLWDSGKVTGDQSVLVPYGGKPLSSRQRVYWKVKVWDKDGKESEWLEPASWEMGLLADKDWVVAQTAEPSWGHMIKSGKAYISERWNRGQPHLGLNSVGAFFYRHLAGIQPAAPGFKTLRLAPLVPEGLDYVKASHHSPYGEIRSEWTKTDGGLEWRVSVPPNTTAVAEAPRGFTFADGSNEKTMLAGSYDLQLPQKK